MVAVVEEQEKQIKRHKAALTNAIAVAQKLEKLKEYEEYKTLEEVFAELENTFLERMLKSKATDESLLYLRNDYLTVKTLITTVDRKIKEGRDASGALAQVEAMEEKQKLEPRKHEYN
jgi:hypothetical protein